MKTYINSSIMCIGMSTAVTDLVLLLEQKWLPNDRREAIKRMLVEMIDRMDDSTNMDDLR